MKEKELKQIKREAETLYSTFGACPNHPEIVFQELEPRMFSFNAPFGACPTCLGLGQLMKPSQDLIIPDTNKSIMQGAIAVYGKMDASWRIQQLAAIGKKYGFDMFTPIKDFTEKQYKILMYGTDERIDAKWSTGAAMNQLSEGFEGLAPQTERLFHQTESDYRKNMLEKFFVMKPCPTCEGKRLKDTILSVKIKGKSIIDITDMSIEDSAKFFKELEKDLDDKQKHIAKQVLKEINERLAFLNNVGLNYLNLSRSAGTLSGGEAQRIRLATQIGSNLTGVLYILDEPSIGLHQRDNEKLIKTLHKLRDIGNTLIVVEHDEDTMKEADYIIDIGPGAGIHGGKICAKGTPQEIMQNKESLTGDYLAKRRKIEVPQKRRNVSFPQNKIFRIGIDIDDVLIDTYEFLDFKSDDMIGTDFKNNIDMKAKDVRKIRKESIAKNLEKFSILDDTKKYLNRLKQEGHRLFVLTSRDDSLYSRTISWLQKEFGKDFFEEILFSSRVMGNSKLEASKLLNLDYMIEDGLIEIINMASSKTFMFIFDKGWNRKVKDDLYKKRVKSFKEFYDEIQKKSVVV